MRIYESWGGQKNYHATADSVEVEADADGFRLIFRTDEGDRVEIKVHGVARELLATVQKEIGGWLEEGERARGTDPGRVTQDDLEAYPLGDPKRVALEAQRT